MSIIREASIVHRVVTGTHKGKECVVRANPPADRRDLIGVVFTGEGENPNKIVNVRIGALAALETPGWEDAFPYARPCRLKRYLEWQKGSGSNGLRDTFVSQPEVVRTGDVLASGETVIEPPRRGWNSSVLIRLDRTGWVEVASRLPLALKGNRKFRFPINLRMGDRLVTGCLVVKRPTSSEVN
ncbi:MAG: hypothetical protein WCJ25_04935 [Candidatus Moraniibacteriota bacterium]